MDKTIADTFNAFWALRYGREQKSINYRLLAHLCRAEADPELKDILKDIMAGFRYWINKETAFDEQDWLDMVDAADRLYKKYVFHRDVFPIIAEVFMYIDRRETKKHGQNGSADH